MENQAMKYTVFVDDNYHYQDEDERYELGEFETFQQAELACRAVVDDFLQSSRESMTAEELYKCYTMFGEDPWISGAPVPYRFSAWNYARERCTEICAKTLHEKKQALIYKLRRDW
jgi:hypothetical protein